MPARWDAWKMGLLGWAVFGALTGGGRPCFAQDPLGGGDRKRTDVPPACEGGYRRTGWLHDFPLDRGWTLYADCAHPERPMVAVASETAWPMALARSENVALPEKFDRIGTGAGGSAFVEHAISELIQRTGVTSGTGVLRAASASVAPARPTVESGSQVRIWRRDGVVAIDMAGIALESGGTGARIRVRVTPGGAVLRGTVRAPGSVELDAPGSGGFAGEGR